MSMTNPMVFRKDDTPSIDVTSDLTRLLCPQVVEMPKGRYRMYFSQERKSDPRCTTIGSAVSTNCSSWSIEDGNRISFPIRNGSYRLLSPAIIKRNVGYRMYFEFRSKDQTGIIKSALSSDGYAWKIEEGSRISEPSDIGYGSPFCVRERDSSIKMYFSKSTNQTQDIWSTTSADGLMFVDRAMPVIKQENLYESYSVYSPHILYINGCWHMYYAGWGGEQLHGYILYARSFDGNKWNKWNEPILSPGGIFDQIHCSEPSLIHVRNRWKIFYEGCDTDGRWRILSATQIR